MRLAWGLKKFLHEIDELDINELWLWCAYLDLYPSGEENAEYHSAMIAKEVYNSTCTKRNSLKTVFDFMPSKQLARQKAQEALMKNGKALDTMFRDFVKNAGGIINEPAANGDPQQRE